MAGFEETSIGFKTLFNKTYNTTPNEVEKLATRVDSNDLSESYTWLGNFPNMREWIGDRDIKKLTDFGYMIKNKLWESSITVPNIHIEYDKVALYKPALEQMSINAKMFSGELVADMIVKGHSELCYDGKAFFATTHKMGEVTYSNLGALELNSQNIIDTKASMMGIKNESGKTLRVNPNMIVAGAKSLSKLVNALDKANNAVGETNPTYKMFEYIILPEISDDSWYMLDTTKPLKPFILQVAKDGVFEASNDDKFLKDAALFGVKNFMNAGYGLWQLAYKSSGVAGA